MKTAYRYLAEVLAVAGLALAATPAAAADAPATAADPPPVTRLITLGTQGGPRVNSTRAQPASLLIVNGTPYLFDAGNGVGRQLALARVPVTTIGRIFITHNHDDHNADWGTLMGLAWSLGRREPIEVYGPRGTESMLLGFLQYFVPNVANRTMHNAGVTPPASVFVAHDIKEDGLVYQDDNIKVTALENCHYHYVPGDPGHGWQKSYAMRVQTPDRVIVFSGDTGECGKQLVEFVRGASILVHEVVVLPAIERRIRNDPAVKYNDAQIVDLMTHMRDEHTTPADIGRLAAAAGVGQVVLSHLAPGSDELPDSAYADGVREFFTGPVVVARDLMEFR
jgi:ribonuclease BN (tRNA processing enzyme)